MNYRSPSFEQDLVHETDGFVDAYFGQSTDRDVGDLTTVYVIVLTRGADNVGGHILDLMLKRLKAHGRVAAW